jgi:ABC-type amino acid transport system permease subunit
MENIKNWLAVNWAEFYADFRMNFITSNRWQSLLKGLGATLQITFFALILGLLIGIVVAAVRSTYDKNSESMAKKGGFGWGLMKVVNGLCNLYLTVIRGTPVVVQLMIFYFVILPTVRNGVLVAILAFGFNSGAYVAEIFRSGIISVDNGQFEAGRSLGFSYLQTMIFIIIPQAFKSVLPTLCNEFIVLLKETSVAGYVGVVDLTKAGDIIRGRTFSAFMPLIAVALVYLVMVVILTALVRMLERRLRKSER